MYKIVYIISSLRKCGPTVQLYYLIKYLSTRQFKPIVLTLSPEPFNTMIEDFKSLNIEIHSLGFNRIENVLKGKKELYVYLMRLRPDLVHTHGIRADKLIYDLKLSVPIVTTVHNYPFEDYVKRYGRVIGNIFARHHFNIIKKAKNPVACSMELAKKINARSGLKIEYIQNGVDRNIFKKIPQNKRNELRIKCGIPENQKLFVVVGSLIKGKNISVIIRAFNSLSNSYLAKLLIIGEGSDKVKLKKLVVDKDKIQFIGEVKNVHTYLGCADYYISASLSEGLPNSVMEAMSCGVPVILSDIESHRELFSKTEMYSFFFQKDNPEQLKNKIIECMNDDYEKLSALMERIIENGFTAEKMSQKYQSLYIELIKNE